MLIVFCLGDVEGTIFFCGISIIRFKKQQLHARRWGRKEIKGKKRMVRMTKKKKKAIANNVELNILTVVLLHR